MQFKAADQHAVLKAIGASSPHGVDFYLAATKLFLAQSLLVSATVGATRANQFGLLGFGGDRDNGYGAEFEGPRRCWSRGGWRSARRSAPSRII